MAIRRTAGRSSWSTNRVFWPIPDSKSRRWLRRLPQQNARLGIQHVIKEPYGCANRDAPIQMYMVLIPKCPTRSMQVFAPAAHHAQVRSEPFPAAATPLPKTYSVVRLSLPAAPFQRFWGGPARLLRVTYAVPAAENSCDTFSPQFSHPTGWHHASCFCTSPAGAFPIGLSERTTART